jgi:hypothetical protein
LPNLDHVPVVSPRGSAWARLTAQLAAVAVLLCLAVTNIYVRATWSEMEDGVLWAPEAGSIAVREIAADSPAERAGLEPGDVLLAINQRPVETLDDVTASMHAAREGDAIVYTVLRMRAQQMLTIQVAQIPAGARGLYYPLAAVGIFSLLVGAAVRFRRPDNQATLHFFWLSMAFFGVLAFSFSGRLDTLDRIFYWGDVASMLLLPPLFFHFALVFPDRPDSWVRSDAGRKLLPLLYLPALLLGGTRLAIFLRGTRHGDLFASVATLVERIELVYLAVSVVAGLLVMTRALRRVRSVTGRRQLRWIVWGTALGGVPFVFGYALPFALGFTPLRSFELSAILLGLVPLAFASAIVRYRLMDVEVIIKRGLVYAAAIAAIAAIYGILLSIAGAVFLGGQDERNPIIALLATMVVVLLSRPVKNAIQTALDRVYYRDRYDYRRALVGFARDLNSDLDLFRLSERLVHRVMETLVVDRMALLLAPLTSGRDGEFVAIAHAGFAGEPPS